MAGSNRLPVFSTPKQRTRSLRMAATTICLGWRRPRALEARDEGRNSRIEAHCGQRRHVERRSQRGVADLAGQSRGSDRSIQARDRSLPFHAPSVQHGRANHSPVEELAPVSRIFSGNPLGRGIGAVGIVVRPLAILGRHFLWHQGPANAEPRIIKPHPALMLGGIERTHQVERFGIVS